jgi:hypothetical protein
MTNIQTTISSTAPVDDFAEILFQKAVTRYGPGKHRGSWEYKAAMYIRGLEADRMSAGKAK